jgi:uncharacterized iron-regulated membrane protein
MASRPHSHYQPVETESGAFFKVAALLLGLGVAVVGFFALMMWADAREEAGPARQATTPVAAEAADHNTALPLNSFACVVP